MKGEPEVQNPSIINFFSSMCVRFNGHWATRKKRQISQIMDEYLCINHILQRSHHPPLWYASLMSKSQIAACQGTRRSWNWGTLRIHIKAPVLTGINDYYKTSWKQALHVKLRMKRIFGCEIRWIYVKDKMFLANRYRVHVDICNFQITLLSKKLKAAHHLIECKISQLTNARKLGTMFKTECLCNRERKTGGLSKIP